MKKETEELKQKIIVELKQKIILEIEEMLSRITLVNTCIVFYKQIIEINREFPEKFNVGKNFFKSVTQAYDYIIISELFKLYEEKAQTGSIWYIKDRCSKNKDLFKLIPTTIKCSSEEISILDFDLDGYIKDIEYKLESKKCKIGKIKEYRNKRIGHNDKKYFISSEKLLEKYPFDFDLFEELIEFVRETLCTIYSRLTDTKFTFNQTLLSGYDLYKVIENINIETVKGM